MSEGLKPCPFCGGPAVERGGGEAVGCADLECPGSGSRAIYYDTPEEAAAMWNRRAVDAPALLALADRFECGSSDYMTRKEVAEAIRRAVGA